MTYWLVDEEPWRTRRRLSIIEPEPTSASPQPPAPQPSLSPSNYHTEPMVHEVPRMLDNIPHQLDESPCELEPVDSSPSTWLLADENCPAIAENESFHQMVIPNGLDCMVDGDDNDKENPVGSYVISPMHVARRLSNIHNQSDSSSFKGCQVVEQGDDIKRPLQSPRYRSAPIITSYHRDSSPSIPLRTTSPQSCV